MKLKQNFYIDASNVYEISLDENYKKNNGIFYTDLALAEKMILDLKIPQGASVLDPCCGTGVFLYAAQKHGCTNIIGSDKDSNAIDFCNKYIKPNAFYQFDTIGNIPEKTLSKIGYDEKVDFIVGNPPYVPLNQKLELNCDHIFKQSVSEAGNNLFVAALMRALSLVKVNGIISYIIPKNFLHVAGYSFLRKKILEEKTIISIIDLGAYFKNVRGEQIVITIKNSRPETSHCVRLEKLYNDKFETLISIPQSFYQDEILLFNCEEDFSAYKKLKDSYQTLGDLSNGYVGRGKSRENDAVTGKDIRKFGYKSIDLPKDGNRIFIQNIYSAEAGIIATFGGDLQAAQTITVFTDGEPKMCRYILGILHSKLCNFFLYKYCYNYSKLTMHTDAKYLKKIPLPIKSAQEQYFDKILKTVSKLETFEYMSQNWFNSLEELNDIIYEAYGLSEKEKYYIDSEMKKIQSKRWFING